MDKELVALNIRHLAGFARWSTEQSVSEKRQIIARELGRLGMVNALGVVDRRADPVMEALHEIEAEDGEEFP